MVAFSIHLGIAHLAPKLTSLSFQDESLCRQWSSISDAVGNLLPLQRGKDIPVQNIEVDPLSGHQGVHSTSCRSSGIYLPNLF